MMTKSKLEDYSIDDWEDEFAAIYGIVDAERRPTEMWLFLLEDASKVAECLRKEEYHKALDALAHVFNWTCSFVWRCRRESALGCIIKKPLSRIVWNKYPYHCPLCANEVCICSIYRKEYENMTPAERGEKDAENEIKLARARAKTHKIPETLDKFTEMFQDIYLGAHYALSIEAIAFHFMEEVGEVSTDIRKLRERKSEAEVEQLTDELEKEIADIISWTMSLMSKLDYILGAGVRYKEAHESLERR
jgi:NTP pyrophosphatase (non-canonical NTP hydrolase)